MHDQSIAHIPLYARGGVVRAYAIVDIADAEWANRWRWFLSNGYACRGVWVVEKSRAQHYWMHRELLGLTRGDGLAGDHVDRDRLNNRRANLRILTGAQNNQNHSSHRGAASQHRGVFWLPRKARWRAAVRVNGKLIYAGSFRDELEAAEAARSARVRLLPYSTE